MIKFTPYYLLTFQEYGSEVLNFRYFFNRKNLEKGIKTLPKNLSEFAVLWYKRNFVIEFLTKKYVLIEIPKQITLK